MGEQFEFRVRYSEPVLRRAVYAFVFHALGGRLLLLALFAVGLAYAAYLVGFGKDGKFAGFVTGFVLCFAAVVILLVTAHLRYKLGTLKRMKLAESTFSLTEQGVSISADSGSTTLPWSAFKEIWGCRGCWLLLTARNAYLTLPTPDVPPGALDFIRSKIPKYRSIVGSADGVDRTGA
jgi:hypothetical protein